MEYTTMENSVYTDTSYCLDNDGLSILEMPYADDLIKVIKSEENLDEFLEAKNSKFENEYIKRHIQPLQKDKTYNENKLLNLDKLSNKLTKDKLLITDFNVKYNSLREFYPESKHPLLKQALSEYAQTGEISEKNLNRLKEKPKGLFNKIKYGRKIKKANQELENCLQYCENKKIYQQLQEVRDVIKANIFSNDNLQIIKKEQEQLNITRQNLKNYISQYETQIQNRHQYFEQKFLPILQKEDEIIRTFVQEVKNPPQLKTNDYIEGLDTLPDDKLVMFNFSSTHTNHLSKILKLQNLKEGSGTNEWLIIPSTTGSSAPGCFSPIMTAKEAKEIMPPLLALRNRCHQNFGITTVIDAESFLAPLENKKSKTWEQEKIDQELEKLMYKLTSDQIDKNRWPSLAKASQQKIYQIYGIDASPDNLPPEEFGQQHTTLEGIKKKFPVGEYLFSGCAVSDNYFSASFRPDRNAYIEATPNLNYARGYSCAYTGGESSTTDKYINTIIGQALGYRIYVGFINVYKEHKDQIFYPNFGIEHRAPQIPKDEAHQHYYAETLIHKDKNPQVAKLLHIVAHTGKKVRECFLEIPEQPDEFIQYLLNQRKADYNDTFKNEIAPVHNRLKAQKQEFDQGIIHGNQPLLTPKQQESQKSSIKQHSAIEKINPSVLIQSKHGMTY